MRWRKSAKLTAYIGFDCTAPSLHVGSMVQIMCLYWLQQTGNKPIALMGGGTTRVGDPSGKDETRKILSIEDIERNKDGIKQVFSPLPALRRGQGRRHHARQCRVADQTELDRDAARYRPAFFGQPHAGDGFGASCASSATRR